MRATGGPRCLMCVVVVIRLTELYRKADWWRSISLPSGNPLGNPYRSVVAGAVAAALCGAAGVPGAQALHESCIEIDHRILASPHGRKRTEDPRSEDRGASVLIRCRTPELAASNGLPELS